MKQTLLSMVQKILSSMDSDEVNDIADTVEASQVVDIIEQTYYDIVNHGDFPEHYAFFSLTASGDPTKPVTMTLPDNVASIQWIKYDGEEVKFQPMDDFVELSLKMEGSNVIDYEIELPTGNITLNAYNDVQPLKWTTYDDHTILFDGYDASVDTTLQSSKTIGYGQVMPTFTRSNTFIPDLDVKQFSLLFNEAKALAWAELKQSQNVKAERTARRGWIVSQKHKRAVRPDSHTALKDLPNYGRK